MKKNNLEKNNEELMVEAFHIQEEYSSLSNEIQLDLISIEFNIEKANNIKSLIEEIPFVKTTPDRLKEIKSILIKNNLDLSDSYTQKELYTNSSIAYEEYIFGSIIESIQKLINKIKQLIEKIINLNIILSNKIDREVKYGILSNIRSNVPIAKYNTMVIAFYEQSDLTNALDNIKKLNFNTSISSDKELEKALPPALIKSLSEIGWTIEGNVINRTSKKKLDVAMINLGWKIDMIQPLANSVKYILDFPIIEGKRAIKHTQSNLKSIKDNEKAIELKNKLKNTKKTIDLVREISTHMAWSVLMICTNLRNLNKEK
jgi:hypothetical protein